jgi:16S rRNA (guanine(966)-N(2))-methyltransferase RsmD
MPQKAAPAKSSRPAKTSKSSKTAKPATPAAAKRPSRPSEVRIIGGEWKRTRLSVADKPGLRPTPDRVRETLFNWLASLAGAGGGELPGWQCVDAFAGTGALGLEAASRGAAGVLLCEQDAALVAQLQAAKTKLKAEAVRIERGNGVTALERVAAGSLDAVFLDPPFESTALYEPALRAAARALRSTGSVYLEAPRRWSDEELAAFGLVGFRYLKAGAVHAHLLRPAAVLATLPLQPAQGTA